MEVWHVPSATLVPRTSHNQNKVLCVGSVCYPIFKNFLAKLQSKYGKKYYSLILSLNIYTLLLSFCIQHTPCLPLQQSNIQEYWYRLTSQVPHILCSLTKASRTAGVYNSRQTGGSLHDTIFCGFCTVHNKTNYKNIYFNSKYCLGSSQRFFILQQLL
jgi:hypothetical protein